MNIITDYQNDDDIRELCVEEWRTRIERAINVEVMTSAEEQFLVQVSDEWFVWVTKPRKGSKTYQWVTLRGKVDMSTFL